MTVVENNKVASVHYTGTLPDNGEEFDSSEGRDPLTFLVGHKNMIPGFERELMGAKVQDALDDRKVELGQFMNLSPEEIEEIKAQEADLEDDDFEDDDLEDSEEDEEDSDEVEEEDEEDEDLQSAETES